MNAEISRCADSDDFVPNRKAPGADAPGGRDAMVAALPSEPRLTLGVVLVRVSFTCVPGAYGPAAKEPPQLPWAESFTKICRAPPSQLSVACKT